MIDVSASTAMGGVAVFETDPFLCFNDARGDAMPSWDAHVGTLINGLERSKAASFVTSITLPPPTPNKRSILFLLAYLMTSFTSPTVGAEIIFCFTL